MNTPGRLGGVLSLLMGFVCSPVFAAGINLSWDECGTKGSPTRVFDCDTEVGANVMIATFDPPAGITALSGISGQVDIVVGTKLPDWWKHGATSCRGTDQVASSSDFSALIGCTNPYVSGAAGGGYNYTVAAGSNPARARIIVEYGLMPQDQGPVTPGTEYYAFQFRILRNHTTGPDACAGCLEPACIVLNSIDLVQNTGPTVPVIEARDRNWITWQSATVTDCPQNTPVRNTTWGRVRAVYR